MRSSLCISYKNNWVLTSLTEWHSSSEESIRLRPMVYHLVGTALAVHGPRGVCTVVYTRRSRGHAVWILVSATCSLHLALSLLGDAYV